MEWTTQQVAERLDIGRDTVKRLVQEKHLTPTNQKAEGAKRFSMRFDSKAIEEFRKGPWAEIKATKPRAGLRRRPPVRLTQERRVPAALNGTTANGTANREGLAPFSGKAEDGSRLARIEAKLDLLLQSI